jgi:hypothetical protein
VRNCSSCSSFTHDPPLECVAGIRTPRAFLNTLVYYMHDGSAEFRFQLSRDLSGDAVRDVEQAWRTASSTIGDRRFVVDVTNLTGIDDEGRELIQKWHRIGALLVANSCEATARMHELVDCPVTLQRAGRKPSRGHLFLVGPRWFGALRVLFAPAKRPR